MTLVYIKGREQDQKSESGRKMFSSTVQLEYFLYHVSIEITEGKANTFSIKLRQANTANTHFWPSKKIKKVLSDTLAQSFRFNKPISRFIQLY